MDNKIDKRFIADEFLLDHFPSPDRFHETPYQTLETSKERYLIFKAELNHQRTRSGQIPLSDSDIKQFIEAAEGVICLKSYLKRL